jgi:N-acetyl-gamma-glutamyl-phosphate reductase
VAPERVAVAVLGASGYVGGELLRLVAQHPRLRLAAALSSSSVGQDVARVFPHLAQVYRGLVFAPPGALGLLLDGPGPLALFTALPHGESAAVLASTLEQAEAGAKELHVVDLGADLRLGDAELFERLYGKPHPAPALLARTVCGLPELEPGKPVGPVAHPGCFTTAVTLAARPLVALDLIEPRLQVSAVTGSTGSGREPSMTTHHPLRHGNLRAYQPLAHRHEAEMRLLIGRGPGGNAGRGPGEVEVLFVPHSGPFARGIHATVFARLKSDRDTAEVRAALRDFYRDAPFVEVVEEPPSIKDVVGSNRCRLAVAARGRDLTVLSVIDNLTKGAAGGAVQWLNRMLGLDETTGLDVPGPGWC